MPLTTKECDREFSPWTTEHQATFEHIKDLVLSADCLTVINYEDTASNIYVTTNASDWRYIEFQCSLGNCLNDSYQLNDTEKNYPVHEKELLSIVKASKKWRSYLLHANFKVFTNHQTLEYFQSQKEILR